MTDAWRLAGRNAIATAAISLIAAIFRLPQPFLAVLAAFVLVGGNSLPHGEIPKRLLFAWIGALSGILVATAIPEQPWMLVPAFALMMGAVVHFASRMGDPSVAVVAAIGAAAGIPSGILVPEAALDAGFFHGINVTCGILCAALAFLIIPGKPAPAQKPSPVYPVRNALAVGISSALSMVLAALFFPADAVIMVVAGTVMGVGLLVPGVAPMLQQRAVGAICGFLLAVGFDVVVAGSGNDVFIFMTGIGGVFGTLAWLGSRFPGLHASTAQAASVFAIAAPMIPKVDSSLLPMWFRSLEVLSGCIVGAAIYLAHEWTLRIELRQLPARSRVA